MDFKFCGGGAGGAGGRKTPSPAPNIFYYGKKKFLIMNVASL